MTLVIHPDGAGAAQQDARVKELRRAGHGLLLLDVFQTGSAVAERNRNVKFYLSFNATDGANRVQDILTALAFLNGRRSEHPRLLGIGKAAGWVRFAQAMAPISVTISPGTPEFGCSDEEFLRDLFVPGVQLVSQPCP